MLEVKDFLKAGYSSKEVLHDLWVLKKPIKDKYTIKVIIDEDTVEPSAQFYSNPVSTCTLQVDNRTTIQEIEDFFEMMYNSVCSDK